MAGAGAIQNCADAGATGAGDGLTVSATARSMGGRNPPSADGLGHYGDQVAARPFGVETTPLESHHDPTGLAPDTVREVH